MMSTFLNAEQSQQGAYISIAHTDGVHIASEPEVLHFIEVNRLNVTYGYGGNSGCGEPWNEHPEVPVVQDPLAYLDENWDEVMKQFWDSKNNVIA